MQNESDTVQPIEILKAVIDKGNWDGNIQFMSAWNLGKSVDRVKKSISEKNFVAFVLEQCEPHQRKILLESYEQKVIRRYTLFSESNKCLIAQS